jgi:ribosomal-protein-alanine N-acetyltransferase
VPRTRDESMEWLNRTLATTRLDAGRETFRVDDRSEGTFLGRVGLRPDAHVPDTELAYALVRTAWGRGIATEAAREILAWGSSRGVTRVVACVLAANVASQRVLANVGMTRIGEQPTPDGELLLYESASATTTSTATEATST